MASQKLQAENGPNSTSSSFRLWLWRSAVLVFGIAALCVLLWENLRIDMSFLVFSCLSCFIISLALLAAMYGETLYNDEALDGQDRALFSRVKRARFPHAVGMICAMSLFPVLNGISKQYWHASMLESWVIGFLPSMAAVRILRALWPVAGESDAESRRLGLLIVDRHRRRQAIFYVVFAGLCVLSASTWIPQIIHARAGLPISLGLFDSVGVPALACLFILAGPSLLGGRMVLRDFPEDETLVHFRSIAYRNGFFVMAIGLLVVCDLVSKPPRLAIVLVPVVLDLALMVAFITMAVLEFRAGTFIGPGDENAVPAKDGALPT